MTFEPGDQFPIGGFVHVRFVQGDKAPGDVRMELLAPKWAKVSMKLGFVFADFYAQNERILYPYLRDRAGDRYINFCLGAQRLGWEAAAERLDLERELARQRRVRAS